MITVPGSEPWVCRKLSNWMNDCEVPLFSSNRGVLHWWWPEA